MAQLIIYEESKKSNTLYVIIFTIVILDPLHAKYDTRFTEEEEMDERMKRKEEEENSSRREMKKEDLNQRQQHDCCEDMLVS